MARRTAIPSQQLERLKELYSQEREALVALAKAQDVVRNAEMDVVSAQRALKEAQSGVDAAYQALVALVGATVAAELTGRSRGAARRARPEQPNRRGDNSRAQDDDTAEDNISSTAMVGGPVE